MPNLASNDKATNGKTILKKKRTNKKKRRTAVSSSSSSSDTSSSDENDNDESDKDMEIEVDNDEKVEDVPELSEKPAKSKLIRDNIQLSDSELKDFILEKQNLLDGIPVSEFINLHNINAMPELKAVENTIKSKAESLTAPSIDKTLKNKFLTEVFKNYSDEIDSLRSSNDFNSKHSLSLLANLLKDGASIFDKDTLESILQ